MGRAVTTPVAIALGSNLGDRELHLAYAASRLKTLLENFRISSFIETDPVGVVGDQPRYLNAVAIGTTALTARELLEALLAIERERGRERPQANAPRTLDLDLILFGDAIIDEQGLHVPHPRFRAREFVLGPLTEIAPDWVDPVTGKSVQELIGGG